LALGLAAPVAARADVAFSAQVDRNQVSEDDSVALKFVVRTDSSMNSFDGPEFNAPDFDVINEYTGTYVESYYENGNFGVRHNQQITKVLKPKKSGNLRITGLSVKVDGKKYTAPDITVAVSAGGAGTPPPKNYGAGSGLRGAGHHANGVSFFVRAEVDQQKVYKGEQVVVSYYLYRKARVFNIQVDKYPTLGGFLREELEMPVMGQRLPSEQVVLDGVPYERSLLVRYAAYPLKEGKLSIDPMVIKANYYGSRGNGGQDDEDDPFMNFFQQMAPQVGSSRSDPVTVEVQALPEPKPESFSGAVGSFDVMSAVDRYEVKANEAISLTLKVEGKGNLASVEAPKVKWPSGMDLYDSKGTDKPGHDGIASKVFEFVLIPRQAGKLELPAIPFTFFDPSKKEYVTKNTEPVAINVLPGAPGAEPPPARPSASDTSQPQGVSPAPLKHGQELFGLKAMGEAEQGQGLSWWRWFYWLSLVAIATLTAWVCSDAIHKRRAQASSAPSAVSAKRWQSLKQTAKRFDTPWPEILSAYESLETAVYDAIDRVFEVGARSMPRADLGRVLTEEKRVPDSLWIRIRELLEYADLVRFASASGGIQEQAARGDLEKWITQAERIEAELTSSQPL
jgi:hypothetical protein